FVFVGEGPDRAILEEKSKELKNIIFTGKREDVHKFYSAFDIFAFPSLYEGFPIVLVEAQCSGVDILMNETIDPTTQIVSELCTAMPLDKPKWVNYIEKTPINEKQRQLNEHLKPFDIEENVQNLKEIYKQGLKRE
ncbi:MAG: glycosyltransferase, partial [Streptococcus mitis]|nr:glycosyltransferase [Streptococcus mitis]